MSTPSASTIPTGVEGQYCFLVEWYDQQATMMRVYHLLYHLLDDTIEMYDIKNRRTFLKRCSYPSITLSDLYLGAQVTIYARQLRLLDYGDSFTRSKLSVVKSRSLALIKPAGYGNWGRIISAISREGYKIGRMKSLILSHTQAQEFYGDKQPTSRASELSQGPILALEIIGAGVAASLLAAAQPASSSSSEGARDLSSVLQQVHIASSERTANSEIDFLFSNPNIPSTATFRDCTLAIIKPHAVQQGLAGVIIDAILQDGFDISALELFNLDKNSSEEFLEVYKGVVPEYFNLVEQLSSGSLIALEIRAPKSRLSSTSSGTVESVVSAFRNFTGPSDPDIARAIRPRSLRAVYGQNKIKNAIHTTDLEEDGVLESQFFFQILQNYSMPTSTNAQVLAATAKQF